MLGTERLSSRPKRAACALGVAAQVLPRADEVTQTLGLDAWHRDGVQLAGDQQPHQPLGVALIGLIRSDGPRGIRPGAHTTQSTPAAWNRRASAKPVGPASYVARTGPGKPLTNSQISPD
jgi:hypothetical protein